MRKFIIWILVILGILIIAAGIAFYFFSQGPDLSQFEHLIEPKISLKAKQKMLVVEAKGDPNLVGSQAFGLLMKAFYKLDGQEKTFSPIAPRARWQTVVLASKRTWTGLYAMPVSEQVTTLPDIEVEKGLKMRIETWEYGEVAEILHIGPYAEETPTIKRLQLFIEQQGYVISGDHEEEYLKGPGMIVQGDPEKYYTIIRYQVRKK